MKSKHYQKSGDTRHTLSESGYPNFVSFVTLFNILCHLQLPPQFFFFFCHLLPCTHAKNLMSSPFFFFFFFFISSYAIITTTCIKNYSFKHFSQHNICGKFKFDDLFIYLIFLQFQHFFFLISSCYVYIHNISHNIFITNHLW